MPVSRARALVRMTRLTRQTVATRRRLESARRVSPDRPADVLPIGHAWARSVVDTIGLRLEVSGALPPGPALWLANHRSYADIPILLSQGPCAFLAKREIADWPVFGPGARLMHTVFVERGDPVSGKAAREAALALLERGVCFAAFPEGTTSRGPGVLPFHPGLFALAERHGFPIVPMAIDYESPDDAWVDDDAFVPHFLRRFGRRRVPARLSIGPRLEPGPADGLRRVTHEFIEDMLG
ncbi:MAG TPA: lysophospholipid acyltransferase family protein [Myxococcota bacterium]|nr:lysophospholipid acyltransferase family protein [Myxococcota bacterium]